MRGTIEVHHYVSEVPFVSELPFPSEVPNFLRLRPVLLSPKTDLEKNRAAVRMEHPMAWVHHENHEKNGLLLIFFPTILG